jgi:CHAD domain-containing protein
MRGNTDMPFHLLRTDRHLTGSLRRLADETVGRAIQQPYPTVHDARKAVKKLRGTLRLVGSGMKAAPDINAGLRDAAAKLSGPRDAEVMLALFDQLGGAPDGHLRRTLAARLADAVQDHDAEAAFRDALAVVMRDVASWRVKGNPAKVLAKGLAATRKRGLRAMAAARATTDPEAMHEWRKQVKAHWYQARLLAPIWPEVMAPVIAEADWLGEKLGEHHDLAVFCVQITALPPTDAPMTETTPLLASATARMADIVARAFPAGARLLAGPPDAVAAIWSDWWQLWHSAE